MVQICAETVIVVKR